MVVGCSAFVWVGAVFIAVMETLLLVSVAFGHPSDMHDKPSLPDCSECHLVAVLDPYRWEGFWIHTCIQH